MAAAAAAAAAGGCGLARRAAVATAAAAWPRLTRRSLFRSSAARAAPASKRIGTHSGTFHCDEALACFLLGRTKQFAGASIVRTRDPAVLKELDILVDVGGEYDPARLRFDHHQRGFETTLSPAHKIKLSSAGLIYKHFGREVLETITGSQDANELDILYARVYHNFVEAIDAIDNGISQYPGDAQPLFVSRTDLSSRVGHLNPAWNEEGVDVDSRFRAAVQLTGDEFTREVLHLHRAWWPARAIVTRALDARKHVHSSGRIILLEQFAPWQSHLFDLEAEQRVQPPVLYVLFCDQSGSWRVQAVAEREDSFASRRALPEPWRGLRDDELSRVAGIPDCIFCHATGFIAGNKTREGAHAMALAALSDASEQLAKRARPDGVAPA